LPVPLQHALVRRDQAVLLGEKRMFARCGMGHGMWRECRKGLQRGGDKQVRVFRWIRGWDRECLPCLKCRLGCNSFSHLGS
jgi:hypothetical protein